MDTAAFLKLTNDGALNMLRAAMNKAEAMGVPQCITVVDSGGHLLAFSRMDGALYQSIDTSMAKARTAACNGQPTGHLIEGVDIKLAIATGGARVNLPGGLPVIVDGHVIGGIGVGSGTGPQDLEVARDGVAAVDGAQHFD